MTTIFNHLTIAEAYEYLKNFNNEIPEVLSCSEFTNIVKRDHILKDCVIYINKTTYIASNYTGLQEFRNLGYMTFINIYSRITNVLPLWEIEYVHDLPEFTFYGL